MTPDSAPTPETSEGLSQIRDILFGQQARHFESRLADLDRRIEAELSQLREELRQRSEAWNHSLQAGLQSLSTQMQEGFQTRDQSFQALSQEVQRGDQALRSQMEQLQAQMAQEHERLRQEHAAAVSALTHRLDEVSRTVSEQADHVRRTMTGRHDLARLLQEVAAKLSDPAHGDAEPAR